MVPAPRRRVAALASAGLIALAACGGDDDSTSSDDSATTPVSDSTEPKDDASGPATPDAADHSTGTTGVPVEASPREEGPSGLEAAVAGGSLDGLPAPAVPVDELRSGGPPPDGIPSIDEPRFVPTGKVDFLADNEPVLAIDIDGDRRAYPVQILIWHEIVNDTVAGIPVTVSYCPLCNTAVAYDRRVDGRILEFGTSGLLWNSALVMYDRQTETLWSHVTAEGVVGVLTGTKLDTYPVATVPWSTWRNANPDGLVLTRDTGFDRSYGTNPYPGYDDVTGTPFLFEGEVDGRFTAMTRVVGIERDGEAIAVPLTELRKRRVVEVSLAGEELVVWWEPGTASALDATEVAGGDDVGATGVFIPRAGGETLTFTASDRGGFTDAENGTTWNLLGTATNGPLTGTQLEAVEHVDTFWFAWSTFRPATQVVTAGASR